MNHYVPTDTAQRVLEGCEALTYPNHAGNMQAFPAIQEVETEHGILPTAPPTKLIGESIHHLGTEPKRILDIGCGTGRTALYLAMNGHSVTAIDIDQSSCDWAKDRANALGIPDRDFTVRVSSVKDLPSTDRYDAVVGEMLLHYLGKHEIRPTVAKMQGLTLPSGLNVVSAYTTDNPTEEITARGLSYMFSPGELSSFYGSNWRVLRNAEGLLSTIVDRSITTGQPLSLIPSAAEVVARKRTNVSQTHIMNANRQIVPVIQYS